MKNKNQLIQVIRKMKYYCSNKKIRPLQLEKSFLKGDINIKQEVIDLILPTYWIINIAEYQKYSENKE